MPLLRKQRPAAYPGYCLYVFPKAIKRWTVFIYLESYCYKDYITDYNRFLTFVKRNSSNRYIAYSPKSGEYALYAWFKVIDDEGNTEATPYNFMDRVEEDIRLKAKWIQVGKYSFAYNPTMGTTGITGDMARYNDPLESGRYYVDGATAVVLQAPTNLKIDAQLDPSGGNTHNIDPEEYIFRGWRIVDRDGKPMENNVFYNPGDSITVNSRFALGEGTLSIWKRFMRKRSPRSEG